MGNLFAGTVTLRHAASLPKAVRGLYANWLLDCSASEKMRIREAISGTRPPTEAAYSRSASRSVYEMHSATRGAVKTRITVSRAHYSKLKVVRKRMGNPIPVPSSSWPTVRVARSTGATPAAPVSVGERAIRGPERKTALYR